MSLLRRTWRNIFANTITRMVCIAAIALTVAHPGVFFPEIKEHKKPKKEKKSKKNKKAEEAGLELSSSGDSV